MIPFGHKPFGFIILFCFLKFPFFNTFFKAVAAKWMVLFFIFHIQDNTPAHRTRAVCGVRVKPGGWNLIQHLSQMLRFQWVHFPQYLALLNRSAWKIKGTDIHPRPSRPAKMLLETLICFKCRVR